MGEKMEGSGRENRKGDTDMCQCPPFPDLAMGEPWTPKWGVIFKEGVFLGSVVVCLYWCVDAEHCTVCQVTPMLTLSQTV